MSGGPPRGTPRPHGSPGPSRPAPPRPATPRPGHAPPRPRPRCDRPSVRAGSRRDWPGRGPALHVNGGAGREAEAWADAAGPGWAAAAAAMEPDEERLSARPAVEAEGLRFLHVTGESPRAAGSLRHRPPCSVGRPPRRAGRAWGGLAGSRRWRGSQGRAASLERAPRPPEPYFPGRRPRVRLCAIPSLCAKRALLGCGYWGHLVLSVCLPASGLPRPAVHTWLPAWSVLSGLPFLPAVSW